MTMARGVPKKRYGLFILAVVLLLSGIVINVIYFNDRPIRSLSLLMLIVGALLVKASNVRGLLGLRSTSTQSLNPEILKRRGRLGWALGVASTASSVIFYFFLRQDELAGGHQVWPAYAFAASGLIGALIWGYVVSKFV